MPLISVCIPCYNGERFIAATIQSVLNQSFTDYEIVVVDDASTDRTLSVLEGIQDSRIRLVRNERNLGMGDNWNKSVSHSRGKYVKLLCGDDLLHPECLERQVAALESPANAVAVLAVCNREVINSHGNIVLRRKQPFGTGLNQGVKLIRTSIRYGSNIIGEPATGLFRRSVLDLGVRFRTDNAYCIDLAFWADILRYGDAYVDQRCLAAFRISDSAVSAQIGPRQAHAFRCFARSLANDEFYQIDQIDLALAYGLSFQWCLLRNVFLKVLSRRRKQSDGRSASICGDLSGRRSAAKLESLC